MLTCYFLLTIAFADLQVHIVNGVFIRAADRYRNVLPHRRRKALRHANHPAGGIIANKENAAIGAPDCESAQSYGVIVAYFIGNINKFRTNSR